jgi:hypothetical protein
MRLTKGQLKRLIREVLEKQGLILESFPPRALDPSMALDPEMKMDLEELEDQLSLSLPGYQPGELYDAIMQDTYEGDGQYSVQALLQNCDDPFLKKQVLKWASQVSAELAGQMEDMY